MSVEFTWFPIMCDIDRHVEFYNVGIEIPALAFYATFHSIVYSVMTYVKYFCSYPHYIGIVCLKYSITVQVKILKSILQINALT